MGMGETAVISMDIIRDEMPGAILSQLKPDEADLVREVSAREDTVSLLVTDGDRLVGYAVMGFDDSKMVTVYCARSVNHLLARAAMAGIFGAAQVMGAPLRVHREKLKALAAAMGAKEALACLDGDGIPMGVFRGV